jgi:hypothetical protein
MENRREERNVYYGSALLEEMFATKDLGFHKK